MAIVKELEQFPGAKCVYVAPSRALCDQIVERLKHRLTALGIRIAVPVSDNDAIEYESLLYAEAGVIVVTQEKLSSLLRQSSPAVREATLFIFDEVHAVANEGRGFIYEQVISLVAASSFTKSAKLILVSAVMPNHVAIREWLDPEALPSSVRADCHPTRTLKGAFIFRTPT